MKKIELSQEDFEFLKELQYELNTQETDGNAQPVFWGVMETKEVGVPEGCGESVIYMGDGGTMTLPEVIEYISDYTKLLNEERNNEWKAIDKNDMNEVVEFMHEVFGWQDVRIVDIEKKEELSMMTGAFLTKRACMEYIQKYGYNHSRPKTFAMTAFRNYELEHLLKILQTMKLED